MKKKYTLVAAVLILMILLLSLDGILKFIVDYQWFKSLGYLSVYFTKMLAIIKFMIPMFILCFVVIGLYYKSLKKSYLKEINNVELDPIIKKRESKIFILANILISALVSYGVSNKYWYSILQFTNSTDFNLTDPVFNKDVSFYIFKLPLIQSIYNSMMALLVILIIVTVLAYVSLILRDRLKGLHNNTEGNITYIDGSRLKHFAGKQFAILASALLIMYSIKYILSAYYLVYSNSGVAFGASYIDLNVTLRFYRVLTILCIAAAIIVFINIRKNKVKPIIIAIATVFVVSILQAPAALLVQRFLVKANELELEKPYLANNIKFTRKAFNIDNIEERDFEVTNDLNKDTIKANKDIVSNIKINSFRPSLEFYNQVQNIRYYYDFNDIDVDRYKINGEFNQVFIAPREINSDSIEPNTWINKHLKYTHGYGIVMSDVSLVTSEGQPKFLINDIPPVNSTDIPLDNPRIYFGEKTDYYAIVNTLTSEFDAPKGGENQTNNYDGKDGINMTFLNRVLYAIKNRDINILLSKDITNESKILFRRNIVDRVQTIAPFIKYDKDPYVVLNEGKLYWIMDGYTTSNLYPYSEPYENINYIRNSVKVVIDAYDGTVDFYISDKEDPIAQSLSKMFKGLFKDIDEMPQGLKSHLRYPQDIFRIQKKVLEKYHMTDPAVFFNGEDLWEVAKKVDYDEENPNGESSYMVTRLPGEDEIEMVMLDYFNTRGKENMVSILGARMDEEHYGNLVLYKFPPKKTIYSPVFFNNKINQDTEISKEITLWKSKGSNTKFGDTLIIPIENSLLYIKPLYIVAEGEKSIPEMKRVIAYYGDNVVMADSVENALAALFGKATNTGKPEDGANNNKPTNEEQNNSSSTNEKISKAANAYNKAIEAQKNGDWAKYGELIKELGDILNNLSK